ncbi:hypothetical protein EYZ11_011852 [Aspergillus tanneri]|uniref:Uncharacterized protein n=1 Tax=Aspergillus tanneri TaxID=1220188 RepID=A0A4S3J1U2_9EURO|nr:hypothetical protein EYZ11_011852 [Aspergillus tanneri]
MLQKQTQPHLERLEPMLGDPFFESILWAQEYDLNGLDKGLRSRIESGQFKRVVFYGMGCSSVVETMKDPATLAFICYSGWSVEPCLFFDTMREMTRNKNLIVLSGGGKIASLCKEHGTSLIQYKLRHADREYPLYHVQQFFSIFLDLFHKLKITNSSYQSELEDSVKFLKSEFHEGTLKRAEDHRREAEREPDRPAEHSGLVRHPAQADSHVFQRNRHGSDALKPLHEFSHTEVATYSDPAEKQAIVTFLDSNADDYTKGKIKILEGLFGGKNVPQNRNIEFVNIDLNQDNFFKKFFFGHFFTVYVRST